MISPDAPAPNKEGPFLPRMNDGGILGRFGDRRTKNHSGYLEARHEEKGRPGR